MALGRCNGPALFSALLKGSPVWSPCAMPGIILRHCAMVRHTVNGIKSDINKPRATITRFRWNGRGGSTPPRKNKKPTGPA